MPRKKKEEREFPEVFSNDEEEFGELLEANDPILEDVDDVDLGDPPEDKSSGSHINVELVWSYVFPGSRYLVRNTSGKKVYYLVSVSDFDAQVSRAHDVSRDLLSPWEDEKEPILKAYPQILPVLEVLM